MSYDDIVPDNDLAAGDISRSDYFLDVKDPKKRLRVICELIKFFDRDVRAAQKGSENKLVLSQGSLENLESKLENFEEALKEQGPVSDAITDQLKKAEEKLDYIRKNTKLVPDDCYIALATCSGEKKMVVQKTLDDWSESNTDVDEEAKKKAIVQRVIDKDWPNG